MCSRSGSLLTRTIGHEAQDHPRMPSYCEALSQAFAELSRNSSCPLQFRGQGILYCFSLERIETLLRKHPVKHVCTAFWQPKCFMHLRRFADLSPLFRGSGDLRPALGMPKPPCGCHPAAKQGSVLAGQTAASANGWNPSARRG